MADAYSRINNGNKTGVCIVQAGPGIEKCLSWSGPRHSQTTHRS